MQETGLYEYKIHGAMDDMDPELCAQVYVDWEYRKKWDSYAIGEYLLVGKGRQWICLDMPAYAS